MNLPYLVRLELAALLGAGFKAAFAQQALEIIPLRHRTVDQVLPALQPLLEPGATLSGSRGQLFLRASASNAEDIKRALAAIDRPAKRLQISVRLDDALERERRDLQASGSIGSGGVRFSGSAQDSRTSAGERVDQRLQILEGSRAVIFAGQSNDDRDFASGFEVVARLAGGGVALEIAQQREMPGSRPGSVHGQRLSTSIQARLGEWVEIGTRIWLKVEALD
jgi:hypothetical protein